MDPSYRAGFSPRSNVTPQSVLTHAVLALCIAAAMVAVVFTAVIPARAAAVDIGAYPPGTVVISQSAKRLYLITDDGQPISYPVAVGKSGKQWRGTVQIDGKYRNHAWAPPAEVKAAEPWLPDYIPGGVVAQSDGDASLDAGAATNMRSTARTVRNRSGKPPLTAAFACSTETSSTSSTVSRSARRSS